MALRDVFHASSNSSAKVLQAVLHGSFTMIFPMLLLLHLYSVVLTASL